MKSKPEFEQSWGFQNYHAIHHLFPRVPFYHYAKIYDEIEAVMAEKGAPVYRLTLRGLEPVHNVR